MAAQKEETEMEAMLPSQIGKKATASDPFNPSDKILENGTSSSTPVPYPKGVAFIALTELTERFAYYGSRAVLTIYMRNVLFFSEDLSTTLYHTFLLLCYCLPIFWGVAADAKLGMFKTLWIVNLLFFLGNGMLTLSSIPDTGLPPVPLTMGGLLLMAVGTGGMKPCLAPFGGEQFTLPQQSRNLQQFFSIFFIATTVGNMLSTVITPVLRKDVECLNLDTCYPLAFGVPCSMMLLAVFIFLAGKPFYRMRQPEGNMLIRVGGCIKYALTNRKRSNSNLRTGKKSHWLDAAEDKYDVELIKDIKGLFGLLIYYLPMPMFYALLEQLGSRWTLQATRMNGQIGGNWFIKPDQMQVSNAIFMFLFTPLFETVVYPLASKCSLLKKPLQRMGLGLFLAGLSFAVAGIVETQIENSRYAPPPKSASDLRIINTLPCPINIQGLQQLSSVKESGIQRISDSGSIKKFPLELLMESCDAYSLKENSWADDVLLVEGKLHNLYVYQENKRLKVYTSNYSQDFAQSKEGNAKLRVVMINGDNQETRKVELDSTNYHVQFYINDPSTVHSENWSISFTKTKELKPARYVITWSNKTGDEIELELGTGGVYVLILHPDYSHGSSKMDIQLITIVPGNKVHILWLLPQYILMAWAQILFIVSGMEFSYTQAPKSMKSVLQALWNLMNAFGNGIVILSVSAQSYIPHSNAWDYFQFSGLMMADVLFFVILAMRYKYVEDK